MIKIDIAKQIAARLGMQERDAVRIVDEICDAIRQIVAKQGRIEIRDFGVFQAKTRKPRIGRNPKRKENEYPIPERRVVTFKMGKELKQALLAGPKPPADASAHEDF
jgi:nucleoid DNA-binding protein